MVAVAPVRPALVRCPPHAACTQRRTSRLHMIGGTGRGRVHGAPQITIRAPVISSRVWRGAAARRPALPQPLELRLASAPGEAYQRAHLLGARLVERRTERARVCAFRGEGPAAGRAGIGPLKPHVEAPPVQLVQTRHAGHLVAWHVALETNRARLNLASKSPGCACREDAARDGRRDVHLGDRQRSSSGDRKDVSHGSTAL